MKSLILSLCALAFLFILNHNSTAGDNTVKLMYKFEPGLELLYTYSAKFNIASPDDTENKSRLEAKNGTFQIYVIETDPAKDTSLLLGLKKAENKKTSPMQPFSDDTVTVFRINSSGECIERAAQSATPNPFFNMLIKGTGEGQICQICFPKQKVKPGDFWDLSTQISLFSGMGTEVNAKSTFVETKKFDNQQCAVITSIITSKKNPVSILPFEIKGTDEIIFDIQKGIVRSEKMQLMLKTNRGPEQNININFSIKLKDDKQISQKQLTETTSMVKKLDKIVDLLFKNDIDSAIKKLQLLEKTTSNKEWKKNIGIIIDKAEKTQQYAQNSFGQMGDNNQIDPNIKSLKASLVNINQKNIKTSAVIKEIEKQTGNKIKLNKNYNDTELKEFKVVNMTFWQTIDQLARQSKNVYAEEACGGGG